MGLVHLVKTAGCWPTTHEQIFNLELVGFRSGSAYSGRPSRKLIHPLQHLVGERNGDAADGLTGRHTASYRALAG
jgi:hypothetical protein